MIERVRDAEKNAVPVFRSVEKVLPINIEELNKLLREKGRILASVDEVEAAYAGNVVFRSMMYMQGWALTAQIGIDRMEYRRLNRDGVVDCAISRDAFIRLLPHERSVRLPGTGAVIVSNAYFEDSYDCLILRADITKYRPVNYLYTMDRDRQSRAASLAAALRRR